MVINTRSVQRQRPAAVNGKSRGKPMSSRRDFLKWLASTGAASFIPTQAAPGATLPIDGSPIVPTGSDLGSLFPLIESQAMKGEFPLSFLSTEFVTSEAWRARAKSRLLELLYYSPPKCDPKAEV